MDVIWDKLRRSEWEAAIGGAPLQQHWDYGAVAFRMGATVRRAEVLGPGGCVWYLQCILRRVGPLRIGWHPMASDGSLAAALSLRREGPLLWLSGNEGRLRMARGHERAVIDLTVPDLRAELTGKWRNRLSVAERRRVTVCESPDIPVWLRSAERDQQKRARYRNLSARWIDTWIRRAAGGTLTLIAGPPDAPVAATTFLLHGSSATYLMGWTGDEGRRLSAHNLLLWTAMERLARRGMSSLDLGRIDPKTPGLNHFKCGTGATIRQASALYAWPVARANALPTIA